MDFIKTAVSCYILQFRLFLMAMNGLPDLGIQPKVRDSDPLRMERVTVSAWGHIGLKVVVFMFLYF